MTAALLRLEVRELRKNKETGQLEMCYGYRMHLFTAARRRGQWAPTEIRKRRGP